MGKKMYQIVGTLLLLTSSSQDPDFSLSIFKYSGLVSFNLSKQFLVEVIIFYHKGSCYKTSVKWKPLLPPPTICSDPKIVLCQFLTAMAKFYILCYSEKEKFKQ